MSHTSLEVLALGLRLGARGNVDALPDDLFTGDLSRLFVGDAETKTGALKTWLKNIGVEWSGVMPELPAAVATALRSANDIISARAALRQARLELNRAEDCLKYPNLSGAEHLKSVVEALLRMPPKMKTGDE